MEGLNISEDFIRELTESVRFLFRLFEDDPDFEDIDLDDVKAFTHRIGDFIVSALASSQDASKEEGRRSPSRRRKNTDVENLLSNFKEDFLKGVIVGQEKAISEIAKALRIGVKKLTYSKKKHIVTKMIFAGPTGVGKTETAKVLGYILKPLGYEFIRVDLNLYRSPESVWTLIGSPRGFVGSDAGGVLTKKIKKSPRAVILFDELEKADPLLHIAFMTLLDEGYIEEQSTGRRYYLDRGIIIFTTNYLSDEFARMAEEEDPETELKARHILETYFNFPELVARIDRVVLFKNLEERDLTEIARRVLSRYGKEAYAYVLTRKHLGLARRYGVRAFIRKLEEEALEDLDKELEASSKLLRRVGSLRPNR